MSTLNIESVSQGQAPEPGSNHSAPAVSPSPSADQSAIAPARPRVIPPQSSLAHFYDKIEAFISRLSTRDNFWQRICSLIWLPYAFFSGIKIKTIDSNLFAAVLPFRKFNRNWYHAMAGGALLANSEIAGGMYLFGICGGDYTVVCKQLNYTFLRPCYGPALYKMSPREGLKDLLATKGEFNITLDMEISQQVNRPGEKDKRVGRCEAVFHITPKSFHKIRKARRAER